MRVARNWRDATLTTYHVGKSKSLLRRINTMRQLFL
jgi:hypothetical protein